MPKSVVCVIRVVTSASSNIYTAIRFLTSTNHNHNHDVMVNTIIIDTSELQVASVCVFQSNRAEVKRIIDVELQVRSPLTHGKSSIH
jgi:hypothetical protein